MPGKYLLHVISEHLLQPAARTSFRVLFLVFAFGMLGCTNSIPNSVSGAKPQLPAKNQPANGLGIQLRITPDKLTLHSGQQVWLKAVTTAVSNVHVKWTTTAGEVSKRGLFTAPKVSHTKPVRVLATTLYQPHLRASATFLVSPPGDEHSPTLTIATPNLPSATAGQHYAASLLASGGDSPYLWSIAAGRLPNGISLVSNPGTIFGAATQQGTFPITLKVTDANGKAATQSAALVVSGDSNSGGCGPPTYPCSRTDLQIAPLPSPIPDVGNLTGANTVITDPDFHNSIARVTDAEMNPQVRNLTFLASAGGSSNANTWNTDSSLIFVQDTKGVGYPMTFDASNLQAARMYVANYPQTGGMTVSSNHFSWSRVNPNFLYVLGGTRIFLYDFTNREIPPSRQLIYDLTASPNCLPAGFRPIWENFGGISAGDGAFIFGLSNNGFQGTGIYAVVYTPGKGCTLMDTRTGQITSDWAQSGTINTPDRFTLHDTYLTLDSGWAVLESTHCLSSTCAAKGPYFWQIGTTNVSGCGADQPQLCSGHWTVGYSHWANNDGDPFGQFHIRRFSNLDAYTPLISVLPPGFQAPVDQHPSWNNANPNDTVPFISSTWTRKSPFSTAWQNEVMGVSVGTGTVSRFAHTFITAHSHRFADEEAIGQVSQDGRFFMFNSDWMGTLGSESGASSCKIGTNCRGDVFVVQLN